MDDAVQDRLIVGQALRKLREGTGLLQEQLAERVGIEVAYISEVEDGRLDVRWHTVMRLLRALKASLSDLAAEIETNAGA
jgi:transcriptional regulator with XRE-family HTH domain